MCATRDDLLLVVCKRARRLDIYCVPSLTRRASVDLSGDTGHEVAISPDGRRAYVPIYGTGTVGSPRGRDHGIDVIDIGDGTLVETLSIPIESHPHDVLVQRDGSLIVTTEGRASLIRLNPSTGRWTEVALAYEQGHMLALSSDETRAWTAHVRPGFVVEIDLRTGQEARHLLVAPEINRISLSPDGALAFVADQQEPRIACIDLSSMSVRGWIPLPDVAFGTAATPDEVQLVCALRRRSSVAIVDLRTVAVSAEIWVPPSPQSMVLDATGSLAFTACAPSDEVVAVHLQTQKVVGRVRTSAGPDGLAYLSRPNSGR